MSSVESAAAWAWENSLAGSILFTLALPILLLFRKPGSTFLRYLLGTLVLARLLLPCGTVQSEISVFNLAPQAPTPALPVISVHSAPARQYRPSILPRVLPILWAAGLATMLARVAIQHLRVQSWLRTSTCVSHGPILDALNNAREQLGIRRGVIVQIVPQIPTPALSGYWKPRILLPPAFAQNPDLKALRMVFLHELAHIRRHDVLLNWAIIFGRAIHWFNPLVWVALSRLSSDQEALCDATVVAALSSEEQRSYGETLLAFASVTRADAITTLPISGNFKQLKERIAMITHFKPITKRRIALAVITAALFSAITFTRAVDKRAEDSPQATTPGRTAKNADLRYQKSLLILREHLGKLEADLEQKERQLDQLRGELGLTGPLVNEDSMPAPEMITVAERELIKASQELRQSDMLLRSLRAVKSRNKLRQILPTAYRDETLDGLLAKLRASQQEYAQLRIDRSDDHPEVKAALTQIKNAEQEVEDRIDGVLEGLETLVTMRRESCDELRKAAHEARFEDRALREKARPYFKLKREIETMRKAAESAQARLIDEELEAKLPKPLF